MNEYNFYKSVTNNDPYPHQVDTYKALKEGQSVILRAPTGSGKSEAVFMPYLSLRGKSVPNRMIYALPMRALVNSICGRFVEYAPYLDVKAQHGQQSESVLFDADCIVATLDQVITSYVCAPLSLGVRHGNIPAGAMVSSFLVFDEVHTFEPRLGLQSSIILAERLKDMKIPFAIMSATLPDSLVRSLEKRLDAKLIDADENSIPVRKQREVMLSVYLDESLSAERVLEHHTKQDGRTIVVCNTVERAITLYAGLLNKVDPPPLLIHSRFLDDHRAEKENAIQECFGKNGKRKALLISTQVIEVGMDISCDLLLTELAPIDALIQRAGRCARWGGKGNVVIFGVPFHSPYEKALVHKTQEVIVNHNGSNLSWDLEKELVNEILAEPYAEITKPQTGARAMMFLSKAAFEGRPSIAEKAVRESIAVEVSIHDNPFALDSKVFLLPKCRLHPGILKSFVKKEKPTVWAIRQDKEHKDDYRVHATVTRINSPDQIYPNSFYVIHSSHAAYFQNKGLILGEHGVSLEPATLALERSTNEWGQIPLETWQEHAVRTLRAFEKSILPDEEYVYNHLAAYLDVEYEKLIELFKITLLLHDLGKLTEEWQKKIGAKDSFLAHSGNIEKVALPPHATVSAYVLGDYLRKTWGPILGDAAAFAMAHHHSVRAMKVPKYRLCEGWYEIVNQTLSYTGGMVLERDAVSDLEAQKSSTTLPGHLPAFEKEMSYNLYVILSRALRLADRRAMKYL